MFSAAWKMLKDTILAFINDEALSRGAAIAFYTVTSVGLAALATAVCKTLLAHEAAQLRLEQVTLQAGGLGPPARVPWSRVKPSQSMLPSRRMAVGSIPDSTL